MKCIIVDDEPIARKGIKRYVDKIAALEFLDSFSDAESAAQYIKENATDLIFLDIQMPGINGMEFARMLPKETMVIFTTAYSEYALDSYDLDAIDYLVKPIEESRFRKAVEKAVTYSALLRDEAREIESIAQDHIFVRSERRFYKINLKDILFIEGLKDYVVIQTHEQRVITHKSLTAIIEMLPASTFMRVNRSYIVNKEHIDSFDNNDIFIRSHEIAIGISYRETFFSEMLKKY